ncbi:hypothetical protein, partial [Klebsiella michiganensis]|uniref:hypothetical protein n=1 Tax=Klebsiella michiganensis TaxID=1134687 RepID=UPI00195443CE
EEMTCLFAPSLAKLLQPSAYCELNVHQTMIRFTRKKQAPVLFKSTNQINVHQNTTRHNIRPSIKLLKV